MKRTRFQNGVLVLKTESTSKPSEAFWERLSRTTTLRLLLLLILLMLWAGLAGRKQGVAPAHVGEDEEDLVLRSTFI